MKYVIKHKTDIQDKFVLLSLCLHKYKYNCEKKIIDKMREREKKKKREREREKWSKREGYER